MTEVHMHQVSSISLRTSTTSEQKDGEMSKAKDQVGDIVDELVNFE